jgi:hypothetical protein
MRNYDFPDKNIFSWCVAFAECQIPLIILADMFRQSLVRLAQAAPAKPGLLLRALTICFPWLDSYHDFNTLLKLNWLR